MIDQAPQRTLISFEPDGHFIELVVEILEVERAGITLASPKGCQASDLGIVGVDQVELGRARQPWKRLLGDCQDRLSVLRLKSVGSDRWAGAEPQRRKVPGAACSPNSQTSV